LFSAHFNSNDSTRSFQSMDNGMNSSIAILLSPFLSDLALKRFKYFYSYITSFDKSKRILIKYFEHVQFLDDEHFQANFILTR